MPPHSSDSVAEPITNSKRLHALAEQFGVEFDDLNSYEADTELLGCFPSHELFRQGVLPLSRHGQRVRIAVGDPFRLEELDELAVATGFFLDSVLAPEDRIKRHLNAALGVGGGTVCDLMSTTDTPESSWEEDYQVDDSQSASVVRLVYELLAEAVRQRASDIHLESADHEITIRFRIDGMLRVQPIPSELYRFRAAMISRLKIMSRLNIAEKRLPQDGRMQVNIDGRTIDIRVSVIPMLDGEEVVLRLLDKSRVNLALESLQLPSDVSRKWWELIHRPHGLLLVTGPTGSGKTTTLYSSLAAIRDDTKKIVTVEDPVEYSLPGISQIQVHDRIGMSFGEGLRSILRHDPDIILIGEIRDRDTAASAIQASLTGHLVLSTLHTNDAPSAVTRLVDMGVEPYLVTSTLRGVLAQRLVRKLCTRCRKAYHPSAGDLLPDWRYREDLQVHRAVGCSECGNTGYAGRLAIFELLIGQEPLRGVGATDMNEQFVHACPGQSGLLTLAQAGWQRVLDGLTSIDEVRRVCVDSSH